MKLTLEDIGRLAGVSRSTVSRVINDQESVSPDVRDRVREVILRTGYSPNLAARSLVSNKTGVIGLVIPSRVHNLFEDPYFARLIQGISSASNQAGTTLTLFLFQSDDEERELYPRVVAPGFLDGVIMTATRMGDPLLPKMVEASVPVVVVGRPDVSGVSYVDADNVGGARQVAAHLHGLGYRRIGLVGAPVSTTAGLDRLNGFVDGLADLGHVLEPDLRVDGDFTQQSGYDAMQQLIASRPDAVFAASDTMAVGALQAIDDAGLRVPDDIAIVGFDGLRSSEQTNPTLTTVRQPVEETGAEAVSILRQLIDGTPGEIESRIMPVELVIRESCGALQRSEQPEAGRS